MPEIDPGQEFEMVVPQGEIGLGAQLGVVPEPEEPVGPVAVDGVIELEIEPVSVEFGVFIAQGEAPVGLDGIGSQGEELRARSRIPVVAHRRVGFEYLVVSERRGQDVLDHFLVVHEEENGEDADREAGIGVGGGRGQVDLRLPGRGRDHDIDDALEDLSAQGVRPDGRFRHFLGGRLRGLGDGFSRRFGHLLDVFNALLDLLPDSR